MTLRFYLGIQSLNWLWDERFEAVPLFVSHHRLQTRKTPFPRARTVYAIDSGAYTHLTRHGRWVETPEQYVASLRRYWAELGPFEFAGQQDSICQPEVRHHIATVTGEEPTVEALQADTVANYLRLVEIAPDLPIAPTIQGDRFEDYVRCADMFEAAGVDLASLPVVGVGSLVGKPPALIERVATALHSRGIYSIHGFGVKGRGIDAAAHNMASADSLGWSFSGRMNPMVGCTHRSKSCAHCPRYALAWWRETVDRVEFGEPQLSFAF